MENAEKTTRVEFLVSRLVYPFFFFGGVGAAILSIAEGWDRGPVAGAIIGTTALSLILIEANFPAKLEWKMTFRSFLRDLKYITAALTTTFATNYLGILLAMFVAGKGHGAAAQLPLYVAVPLAILVFDFVQYWVHRWMHETHWPLGGFLWRIHAAHHLPDKLYVLMHPAAHPLNDILVRHGVNVGLIALIGFNADAVFLFSLITGLSGLFSHFNVDVRAGFMNYLFVSTELHRYHHSADPRDAKNFGVTTPFWDIVFGTFVYRPGVLPARIGVDEPALYPHSNEFWRVMALPFRGSRTRATPDGAAQSA